MIKHIKHTTKIAIYFFAIIGFILTAVYFAVRLNWTNTSGIIDTQNEKFWSSIQTEGDYYSPDNYCLTKTLAKFYPTEAVRVLSLALANKKDIYFNSLQIIKNNLKANKDNLGELNSCLSKVSENKKYTADDFLDLIQNETTTSPYYWANTREWKTFKAALIKDLLVLDKVEKETGINKRLLVAELATEQLRLFNSQREIFESVFAPLKILGSQSQFSWGILGIKPETATIVENNLKDKTAPEYLGKGFENTLDFQTADKDQERFTRITNEHDHYYAYLYAALYNKEIIAAWKKAGYDISNRPEILATLYNIGFTHSKPKQDPQIGGAEIDISGKTYSFGGLAYEFYYSGELINELPY
jgi:hypothetical protein